MREIKFRGWGVKSRVMVSVGELAWTVGGLRARGPGCYIEGGYEMGDIVRDDNIIIMQFTGLRDASNQEIYEGDILKDKFGRIFEVFWMDGITEYDMESGWWVRKHEGDHREVFTMHQWRDNMNMAQVVVGNIYETPELLKGT